MHSFRGAFCRFCREKRHADGFGAFNFATAWRTVLKLALALTAISMAWLIDSCVLDFMRLNLARLLTGFTCGVELWSFCLLYTSPSPRD